MGLRNGPSNIKSADFLFHFKNYFALKYVIQSSHAQDAPLLAAERRLLARRHTGILSICFLGYKVSSSFEFETV